MIYVRVALAFILSVPALGWTASGNNGSISSKNNQLEPTIEQAGARFNLAFEADPDSTQTQLALYDLAAAQCKSGNLVGALKLVNRFEQEYPDSRLIPDMRLLQAEFTKSDHSLISQSVSNEKRARIILDSVISRRKSSKVEELISELRHLAAEYPDTPTALSARESVAHLLSITTNTELAMREFQNIVDAVEAKAPNSRIVQNAYFRLGALNQRLKRNDVALQYYEKCIDRPYNTALSDNAMLQSAGLVFEIGQHEQIQGKLVPDSQWDEVRRLLTSAKMTVRSENMRVRAELMELESYIWSHNYPAALEVGKNFIDTYSTNTLLYRKEVATAYLCMARIAKEMRCYDDCIIYTSKVLALYPKKKTIWSNMDHLQRAYFDLIESLFIVGRKLEAEKKMLEFRKKFPFSSYVKFINTKLDSGQYNNFQTFAQGNI